MVSEIKCEWCERVLSADELECPHADGEGNSLCDECYFDQYTFICCHCDESMPKEQEGAVGNLIAVYERVGDVVPGLYKILCLPYYVQALVGVGFLLADNLIRVADIPDSFESEGYMCDHLCCQCSRKWSGEATDA